MSISAVSSAVPQYLVPTTPNAKTADERAESSAVKSKETESGKESVVSTKPSAIDIKA